MLKINKKEASKYKNSKELFDQIFESFRRKGLTLFLKNQIKALGENSGFKVTQVNTVAMMNRYGETKVYKTKEKNVLKTELQEMFNKAEMIGYAKMLKGQLIGSPKLVIYMIVLTNLGILVLE